MFALGFIGKITFEENGFGARFPKLIQELTSYKYDFQSGYREGTCFLKPDQNYKNFENCESQENTGKDTILLWGDSHAAHLYPGYKAVYANSINLIQRTASACPPIIEVEVPNRIYCKEINDSILAFVKVLRPNRIVLAAVWTSYDWQKIEITINELKKIGIAKIDLVGPVPQWIDGLSKQLFDFFSNDLIHRVPYRMDFGLDKQFIQVDAMLQNIAARQQVNYMSPKNILCNIGGCLTRLGDSGETLITWDRDHLTSFGSEFLVSKFASN